MNFELEDEHRMLRDLVQKFVAQELMPLEAAVLERDALTGDGDLTPEERGKLDAVSKGASTRRLRMAGWACRMWRWLR
jgi:acyl-CoA dehydrogenase